MNFTEDEMSSNEQADPPYSYGQDVATWYYAVESNPPEVDLRNAQERAPWLAKLVQHALTALSGFAKVYSIEVTTDSHGEDSFVIETHSSKELKKLDSFLRSTPDVSDVDIFFHLQCVRKNPDGSLAEFSTHDGWLFIANYLSKDRIPVNGLIRLSTNIQTDIYSPVTNYGDNREIAALNLPRLRNFIRRLEELPSLKLLNIGDSLGFVKIAQRYAVFDHYGYKMPDDPRAFETLLRSTKAESGR